MSVPTKHPSPTLSNNVSRYNPYNGVDRGLSIHPEDNNVVYRVKSAVWTTYGFNTAPGVLEFILEKFTEFPGVGEVIQGPGLNGSFNCATRTSHNNPVMIEEAAHHIYQTHYLMGGPLLTQEEINPLMEMGRGFVISEGAPHRILQAVSTLTFESPDGIQPIAPVSAEITYTAIFKVPPVNPGDAEVELREYTFQTDPTQFDPMANIINHINQVKG